MAVGKNSMARAAKAGTKGVKAKRTTGSSKTVIAAPDEKVMKSVVYEGNRQMLDRDALPGETFKIGDAMPVYYF